MYKLLFTAIAVLLLSTDIFAQNIQEHRVRAGETLFSISRQYNVSVDQLREWNSIQNNQISIDQILIVGKHTEESDIDTETVSEAKTHRVLRGETLFSISRTYDITVQNLMEWNELSSTSISVGQYLYVQEIPTTPEAITESSPDTDEPDVPTDTVVAEEISDKKTNIFQPLETSQNHYTVKPGDTMYRVANMHNMTVQELQELNNLSNTILEIGDRLLVRAFRTPPSVLTETVRSTPQGAFLVHTFDENDNILDLLSHYRMDRSEFIALNPDKTISDLRNGDRVTLLVPPSSVNANPYRTESGIRNVEEVAVSKYDDDQIANTLTSGELYNPDQLTAAHPSLPLGSAVYIENPDNGKGLMVLINDRVTNNNLRLSHKAYQFLQYDKQGASGIAIIYQDIEQ